MIHELRAALLGISSYRALMEEPLMGSVRRLLDALVKNRGEEALEAYTDVFYRLRREGNMGLGEWIWDKLRYLESPYPTALGTGVCDPALESAARRDIETLALLAGLDCDRLISSMAKRLAGGVCPCAGGIAPVEGGSALHLPIPHRVLPGAWGGTLRPLPGLPLVGRGTDSGGRPGLSRRGGDAGLYPSAGAGDRQHQGLSGRAKSQ